MDQKFEQMLEFTKGGMQIVSMYMKICSTSLIIRIIQIKTTM